MFSFLKTLFGSNTSAKAQKFEWLPLTSKELALLNGDFVTQYNPYGVDPLKWVDPDWDDRERTLVINYFKSVKPVGVSMGVVDCVFRCKKHGVLGPTFYENQLFKWTNVFLHVVENHHVKPPQSVIDYINFVFSRQTSEVVEEFRNKPVAKLERAEILAQQTYLTNGRKGSVWIVPNKESTITPALVKALRTLSPMATLSTKEIYDLLKVETKQCICKPCDFCDFRDVEAVAREAGFQLEFHEA